MVKKGAALVKGDEGLRYSIIDYLNDRIKNSDNPKMVQLAKDMKAYCTYAKHYFDVRDGGSKEELPQIDDFQKVTAQDLEQYACTVPTDIEHFAYKGTSLMLESNTSFRLYFSSDDKSQLTVTCGGKNMEVKESGGFYYVEVTDISARNINKMYDITVSNGTDTSTAHHGPLGYAHWALLQENPDAQRLALQRTMMGLYRYNQSAETYFAAQGQ